MTTPIITSSGTLCPSCSTKDEQSLADQLIQTLREQIWAQGFEDLISMGSPCLPLCTPRFYRILSELTQELLDHDPHTIILDVSDPTDYQHAHIPGAHSLPRSTINTTLATLPYPKTYTLVITATHPVDALIVGKLFALAQYTYIFVLIGGTPAWQDAHYPIHQGPTPGHWIPQDHGSSRTQIIQRAQAIIVLTIQ